MPWEFIATEFVDAPGEVGERLVWEAVIQALKDTGDGIGILNYTDFKRQEQRRYQPDILLVSRDWGLAVIEVKSFPLEQLRAIRANQWEMSNFYERYLYPFKQGEHQLRQILKRCDRRESLQGKLSGRVSIALPRISRSAWQERGFEADHPTCPPLLFSDELSRRRLQNHLSSEAIILVQGGNTPLAEAEWQCLRRVILGHPQEIRPREQQPLEFSSPPVTQSVNPARREVLTRLQRWLSEVDLQQATLGLQIPPGPQRIRGIAGSGKTVLLCQRAARLHLQYPDWDIALVFFTRSLYELMVPLVQQWLHHWSDGQVHLDPENGKLKILHAWGSRERAGFYSRLRDSAGQSAAVSRKPQGRIPERLAAAAKRLLESGAIAPCFDAILIDEGQDLAVGQECQYQDKEAIYWLAWQALRPVSPSSALKRLTWAYDEAQNLDALGIPSYGEVFGQELGNLLSGATSGPLYPGGTLKSVVLRRCYRTPGPILVAAHALGMGLLRTTGIISSFTTQTDWERIGYEVQRGSFISGQQVTLHRPAEHSPNPVPGWWGKSPVAFEVYPDREAQLAAVVQQIQRAIQEGLHPSRDILMLVLGADQEEESSTNPSLQRQVANALQQQGLSYYLPGAHQPNRIPEAAGKNPDRFWWDGATTVSRIYRAKGQEAPMVFVLGLELVAEQESRVELRNQLFVTMTRSLAWLHLGGIQEPETESDYVLYDEIRRVLESGETLNFTYRPPKRNLVDQDAVIA